MNSAHSVFTAIGGTAGAMIGGRTPKIHSPKGGKQIKGAEPKATRNYRRRYNHILSEYLAGKNLDRIHQSELK